MTTGSKLFLSPAKKILGKRLRARYFDERFSVMASIAARGKWH
jgi:hypothetical protein